jgi:hypothetical protein
VPAQAEVPKKQMSNLEKAEAEAARIMNEEGMA